MKNIVKIAIMLILPILLYGQTEAWAQHSIIDLLNTSCTIYAIDIDNDNDIDVLSISNYSDNVIWWENEGGILPSFIEHTIDDDFDGPYDVYATDLDNDDDVDIMGTAFNGGLVAWWESDGSNPPGFTRHIIANLGTAYAIYAENLDGDDDIDVIATSYSGDRILWFENDGTPPTFTEHMIDNALDGSFSVFAIDMDNDIDIDVLASAGIGDDVIWYENDGTGLVWTKHTLDDNFDRAHKIYAIDLDEDTDMDVLCAAVNADQIAWWESDGNNPPGFTKHIIANGLDGAISVFAIDMDNDSDVDVLGAAENDSIIVWFENDGNENFTEHIIGDFPTVQSIFAIDLNDDNSIDVLGSSWWWETTIAWWEKAKHDVGPMSINIPDTVSEGTVLQPQAIIKNFGNSLESSFLVSCRIEPGDYLRYRTIYDLLPYDTVEVNFFQNFTFEEGSYTVTVCTQLVDDVPENDTLIKVIETTGISEENGNDLKVFSFGLNTNPSNQILFNLVLPQDGLVTLKIYDAKGRLVDNLSSYRLSGYHQISWKAETQGVYFYTFESSGHKESGKLVVVR